jgi:hypothetical protein
MAAPPGVPAPILDLHERGGHFLSPALWAAWAEAAAVALERYHAPPPPARPCTITSAGTNHPALLIWLAADDVVRASHANEIDATELGAYVVAAASIHAVNGWRVAGRTHQGSGSDFIMLRDADPNSFVKVEVSGVGECDGDAGLSILRARLRQKIDQVGRGDLDLPGMAVVVGFQSARILVSEVRP